MCTHRGGLSAMSTGSNPTVTAARDWTKGTVNQQTLANFKASIVRGIATHTPAQNDNAERSFERDIAREEEVAKAYDIYVASAHMTGPNDPWWQGHQETLGTLKAELAFFRAERKRQGR